MGKQGWCQAWSQGSRSGNVLEPYDQTWHQTQMTQIYSNPLKFFASPCPEWTGHAAYYPVFYQEFF